jgi:SpoIID/LytB domain protein
VAALALATVPPALPAAGAQESDLPEVVRAEQVEITPSDGAALVYEGRRYGGTMRVTGHPGGLAVVETVSLDAYLAGIQEVPFSWEAAALQAQAIAARTYLAWTLAHGRTSDGEAYDYDICATDACQVYSGLEPTLSEGGDRWLEAVRSTGSRVLLYDGSPARAYYSSTSGGNTRDVGDVWPDLDLPYLEGVESPGEDSPFTTWSWWLPEEAMEDVLAEAGLVDGDLVDITTTTTDEGGGPWTVTITSDGATVTRDTWELRGTLNWAGPSVVPDRLPARRADGATLPQTILSPTYTIESQTVDVPGVPVEGFTVYVVEGAGWGHQVGMSQYGAQAMAESGSGAADILAHFYGGLRPTEAPEVVPDQVEVALDTGGEEAVLEATGPVTVTIDGRRVAADELGTWTMRADGGSVEVAPPVGLGLPPEIRPGRIGFDGLRPVLRPEVTVASRVRWELMADGEVVVSFGPENVAAGPIEIPVPLGGEAVELVVSASNRHGGDRVTVAIP